MIDKSIPRWFLHKLKLFHYKILLRKMVKAMQREGWDAEDIRSVLFHIGGEVSVLTPSVKERMGRWKS